MVASRIPSRARSPLAGLAALTLVGTMAVAVAPSASAVPLGACAPGVVTLVSDPNFQINTTGGDDANYIGYAVTPAASVTNLWVGLATSGAIVSLAPGQPAAQPSGPVAASATVYTYFLAKASAATASAQAHTVTLYDGNPTFGGTALCTYAGSVARVDDTITANANKVDSITITPSGAGTQATVGQEIVVTAVGATGTIGAGPGWDPGVINLSPASFSAFPSNAWRLVDITLTTNPGTGTAKVYRHLLHLANSAADQGPYTVDYTFRAVGVSATAATVMPIQYIASGTQVKRTGTLPKTLPTVGAVESKLSIAKSASPTTLAAGGDVTYTVDVDNLGPAAVTVDDIVDTIPVGATYKAGSYIGGTPLQSVVGSTTTLVFPGPFDIAASGSFQITYTLTIPNSPGRYVNSAVAYFGSNRITATGGVPAAADVVLGSLPAAPTVAAISKHTAFGTAITVTPVVTGTNVDPTLACIVDPVQKTCDTLVTIPGKGVFTVAVNGDITFTPAAGFAGAVPTVTYRVTDATNQTGSNTVDIYVDPDVPVASPLSSSTPANTPVTLNPSVTGAGADVTTTCLHVLLAHPCVTTLVVPDEGTWTVAPSGAITFTPLSTFDGAATVVVYDVTTTFGDHAHSTVTVTVGQGGPALPPAMRATVPFRHTAVLQAVPTLGTSPITGYCIELGTSCTTTVKTSKGTWTVSATGRVTFVPASTFYGVAGPMALRVTDDNGLTATSAMTVVVGKPALHVLRQSIFFASGSPIVTPYSVMLLRRLAAKVPTSGTMGLRVRVTGYVQPTRSTYNDFTLSTRRAVNVSGLLKRMHLGGTYIVSGRGRALQTGAVARRVVVTISWYA